MNKPTVGRIVHYFPGTSDSPDIKSNFLNDQLQDAVLPAVITRVWSDTCVNLKVLTDGPLDAWKTSVSRTTTEDKAYTWDWPVKA